MFFIENNGDRATKEEKYRMWPSWQGGVAKHTTGARAEDCGARK